MNVVLSHAVHTGGTNFGFMNGANYEEPGRFRPTITSYGKQLVSQCFATLRRHLQTVYAVSCGMSVVRFFCCSVLLCCAVLFCSKVHVMWRSVALHC